MYYLKVNDGAKIAVEDINREAHKTVVLVHGWPIRKEMYEYQKNLLLDKGYRVVSYDIRGFGNSSVPKSGYHYNQLATDLYCVIDNLKVDSVTLVGFSMGGAIAVHYMAMYDNYKVSKLILAGAAVPSFTKTIHNPYGSTLENTNQLITQTYQDRPNMVTEFGNKVFALNHSDSFKKWFQDLCFSASGYGTIQTAISLRDEDVYDDLKEISVPTAIFHGKLDQICPFEFAKIMEKEISNSVLVPFEFSGHGLFYDERDKFSQLIIEFIES